MKARTLFTKAAAGLGTVALLVALGGCSHNKAAEGDYGNVRTEQAAQQQATTEQAVGTAPAPTNAQGAATPSAPAIISGPAKVDNSGNVYTSSSSGGTGNASATGLNTNVNVVQKPAKSSVTITETPAPVVTETTTTTTVETAPPPAPAPTVVEAPPPMVSSTTTTETTTTTTTHKRLRKD